MNPLLPQLVVGCSGTVVGAIFGFFALKLTDNTGWIMTILLFFWTVIFGMVRLVPQYGYAGLVGAFTAPVVIMSYETGDYGEIAIARIEMTCYGVLIWLVVCFFVYPARASVQILEQYKIAIYAACDLLEQVQLSIQGLERDTVQTQVQCCFRDAGSLKIGSRKQSIMQL